MFRDVSRPRFSDQLWFTDLMQPPKFKRSPRLCQPFGGALGLVVCTDELHLSGTTWLGRNQNEILRTTNPELLRGAQSKADPAPACGIRMTCHSECHMGLRPTNRNENRVGPTGVSCIRRGTVEVVF